MKNSKENDNGALSDPPELPSTVAKQYGAPPLLTALIVKAQREGKMMQHLARVLAVSLMHDSINGVEARVISATPSARFTSMLLGT